MKLFKNNITYFVSSFILLGFFSLPVVAGGYSITLGYGGHNNHHNSYGHHYSSKQNNYGKHYNYGSGHRNSYSYKQHNYPDYQQKRHNNYNNYGNHSTYKKPCHQVSKTVVDSYGEYRKIGGTMCYDSYGQGYVVSGSRYQIH